jgi:K+-transporting ATPase ATPase A chain
LYVPRPPPAGLDSSRPGGKPCSEVLYAFSSAGNDNGSAFAGLSAHTPLFATLLVGVVLLVGALTFIPALALGPIVDHLVLAAAK